MAQMEAQYLGVLRSAMAGNRRTGRNGTTRAVFAAQLRHDLRDGFPLLTTKRMPFKTILAELLWFIEAGRHSPVPYRLSNERLRELTGLAPSSRTIWTLDSEKPAWLAKARFPGDCGRIYGAQWRNWNGHVDQLAQLVTRLREQPESRYLKVIAWNPGELDEMCLPPCHGDFQCFVRFDERTGEKLLSLHMNQRSCDLFLGVPFNIASYALLLMMLAQLSGMTPHELVMTLNDAHVYEEHLPAVETQLAREPHPPPRVTIDRSVASIDDFRIEHFALEGYRFHDTITARQL
ncbi:MAG TPA: thymidylate synthase [Anaeromyxobacteraceae bacterium]|nr:thymidylate synthase [Anaeromyxobacteraceae bacterium]